MSDHEREQGRDLVREYIERGEPSGWFEPVYASAQGDASGIGWATMQPNARLVEWLEAHTPDGNGKRALVVGCGLGDDAEEVAHYGFEVVAFDISPTAIEWSQKRFPDSAVNYQVADLFSAPESWQVAFDFVLESYTLQALPPEPRHRAMKHIARFVAPGGTLLIICRGGEPGEDIAGPPWRLTRAELDTFTEAGLTEVAFDDLIENDDPSMRHFRVEYRAMTP